MATRDKMSEGKMIVPYGVYPEKHEYATASVFLKLGKDVEFIKPSGTTKIKSPDIMIDGSTWEMKSPTGRSKYTIQNQFKRAAHQSSNLIFDARRLNLHTKDIEKEIYKQFSLRRSIRKIKLITKSGDIVDFIK